VRFLERLNWAIETNHSGLCIGLDPDLERFPAHLPRDPGSIVTFNRAIIEATADLVCAYKPNLAFYLVHGEAGLRALLETRRLIPPEIPVILDAKVGDIPTTSAAYAEAFFERWGFDAVTAHPYAGEDGLAPLLRAPGRGVFVLVKTSNPGAGEFQELLVRSDDGDAEPLYLQVARHVARWNERYGSCGLVAGATYPAQLAALRSRYPELPILIPGVGAQAGNLEAAVSGGLAQAGAPIVVNASRSVIYAGHGTDFAQAARAAATALRAAINHACQRE
jgi:orotidine-5'-phosphate decarboxylase